MSLFNELIPYPYNYYQTMISEEENLRKIIEESEKKIMDAKAKLELIEKKKFEEEITRLQE